MPYLKQLFCDNWFFSKQDKTAEIDIVTEIKDWKPVDIPHDWLIWQTAGLYESSNGFYRKTFTYDGNKPCVSFRFEGVYMNSSVYINGSHVFDWKYGYSTFEFDASGLIRQGENEIVVIVRHHAPNSRWYSGAGIYRPVYMITRSGEHFSTDGIYFSAVRDDNNKGLWTVRIEAEIINPENKSLDVRHKLTGKDGRVFTFEHDVKKGFVEAVISEPHIWDTDNPQSYALKSELIYQNEVIDTEECTVGFRKTEFLPDGFFLNGRKIKFSGVCLHHDLGALGAAVNKAALRRQLESMLDMGVNAVRTSHNMPSKEFMELADELGILIISEAFDMWQLPKTEFDYARFFDEWMPSDVASWVRRDRNHPSVIMWSIGNEIYDTHCRPEALSVTKLLYENVLKHDPYKNAVATIGSNYMWWEPARKCADVLKIAGYNYSESVYDKHHEEHPDWFIYGSETASRVQSRGIYHFPADCPVITYEDLQCSGLENSRSGLGDRTLQYSIKAERDNSFSGGQFIWTGADYIGEPSPYWTKNSYFGQIDTAGLKKDQFYLYRTMWKKDASVLHLFPYWDFNEGQLIDVYAYTTCPKVELYLNDVLIGTEEIDIENGEKLNCCWRIPYSEGTLKAIGYDINGVKILEDVCESFGDGVKLMLEADKTVINADGEDISFITISTVDENGVFVANAKSRMNVTVSGAGRLVGLDSGDSTDYDEYKGTSKKLFGGKLVAMVAAKDYPGDCAVTVSSMGFESETLKIEAVPAAVKKGISCAAENIPSPENNEIPVRKIGLKAERTKLDRENMTSAVEFVCYPLNNTYNDPVFRVVTNGGIETNNAKVEITGGKAVVTAVGDGEFRLRATCRNGKEFPEVLSDLEFIVEGVGAAVFDPYSFIPASLSNASSFVLDGDLDGGIRAKPEMTCIGFKNVDFGETGSSRISIPIIHWHTSDPLPIEIWKGMPYEEGAVCVYRGEYKADFIWQTYQENTFELSETLTGIQTICIALRQVEQRVSVKGFVFEKSEKAYAKIPAVSNNRIFGDSFTINEKGFISHIKNNVTVEFDGMDFTKGFRALTVRGRTYNRLDSVHIIFTNDTGSERRLAEFKHTEKMTEKTFKLDGVTGLYQVKFVFLPGADFDFEWFRFE